MFSVLQNFGFLLQVYFSEQHHPLILLTLLLFVLPTIEKIFVHQCEYIYQQNEYIYQQSQISRVFLVLRTIAKLQFLNTATNKQKKGKKKLRCIQSIKGYKFSKDNCNDNILSIVKNYYKQTKNWFANFYDI